MAQLSTNKDLLRLREYSMLSDASKLALLELAVIGGRMMVPDFNRETLRDNSTAITELELCGLAKATDGILEMTWDCIKVDNSTDRVRLHRAAKQAGVSSIDVAELAEMVSAPPAQRVEYQSVVDLYHEILPTNPRVLRLNEKRRGNIRARWNELKAMTQGKSVSETLDMWRWYFTLVSTCGFLCGRKTTPRGVFFADLEWLVNDSNFSKVVENKYTDK